MAVPRAARIGRACSQSPISGGVYAILARKGQPAPWNSAITCSNVTSGHSTLGARTFTTSIPLRKKKGKANLEKAKSETRPTAQGQSPVAPTAVDDAFDFSGLESSILKAMEQLTHDLAQLRPGGRLDPSVLESIKVQLDKSSQETLRISDLAQVIPRGRNISVVVGDKDVSQLFNFSIESWALFILHLKKNLKKFA